MPPPPGAIGFPPSIAGLPTSRAWWWSGIGIFISCWIASGAKLIGVARLSQLSGQFRSIPKSTWSSRSSKDGAWRRSRSRADHSASEYRAHGYRGPAGPMLALVLLRLNALQCGHVRRTDSRIEVAAARFRGDDDVCRRERREREGQRNDEDERSHDVNLQHERAREQSRSSLSHPPRRSPRPSRNALSMVVPVRPDA